MVVLAGRVVDIGLGCYGGLSRAACGEQYQRLI